jgi:hypothetical protein
MRFYYLVRSDRNHPEQHADPPPEVDIVAFHSPTAARHVMREDLALDHITPVNVSAMFRVAPIRMRHYSPRDGEHDLGTVGACQGCTELDRRWANRGMEVPA